MQNTRATRLITFRGISLGLSAWARRLGVNKETLRIRLQKMPVNQAFTLPTKKDSRRKSLELNVI